MNSNGGVVYLMLRSDGLWKLGSSLHMRKRRSQLERQYELPVQIRVNWEMGNVACRFVERAAHQKLVGYLAETASLEVYRAPRKVMIEAVESAIEAIEAIAPDGLYRSFPLPANDTDAPKRKRGNPKWLEGGRDAAKRGGMATKEAKEEEYRPKVEAWRHLWGHPGYTQNEVLVKMGVSRNTAIKYMDKTWEDALRANRDTYQRQERRERRRKQEKGNA